MANTKRTTTNFYALLIGVDCYLPNRLPEGRYPNLGGCVPDITKVEKFLQKSLKLPKENIFKLTATDVGEREPAEPEAQWPTYENIVAAFKRLTVVGKPGDQVYIHYSGHGGRTLTTFADLKGKNGVDETLVPTDIGNSTARYLRDIELAYLMKAMVDKGLIATLVLDSCHAGGATRGEGGARRRGAGFIDRTSRPTESLVASDKELAATWRSLSPSVTRNVALGSGWLPEPKGYVLLAACRAHESAHEFEFEEDKMSGALTYWLLDTLKQMGQGATYETLHNRILGKVHSQFPTQTPQLQGEGNRLIFGSEQMQLQFAVNVMQVDAKQQQILLQTGQAQGVRKGARFAIYPPGITDFTQTDQQLAVVEVVEARATDSWAEIKTRPSRAVIEEGAQAVLLDPGNIRLRRSVRLVQQEPKIVPTPIDQKKALQEIERALKEDRSGFVLPAEANKPADYQVAVNEKGEYEIWDAAGEDIPNLRPAIKIGERNAATQVVKRLVHLTKYQNILELDNFDPNSPLTGKLSFTLAGWQKDYDPADRPQPKPFGDPGNTATLETGVWAFVQIKNNSSQVLNVAVLDLQPDWGITQVFPRDTQFLPLDPGQEQLLPLQANLPTGYTSGRDVLKIFATIGPVDFRWLELPALDQPPKPKGGATRGAANPLEALFAAIVATKPKKRNFDQGLNPSGEWVAKQLEVEVKRG
jgi:hypothetical protein